MARPLQMQPAQRGTAPAQMEGFSQNQAGFTMTRMRMGLILLLVALLILLLTAYMVCRTDWLPSL